MSNPLQVLDNLERWGRDSITVFQSRLGVQELGSKAWVHSLCEIRYHEGLLFAVGVVKAALRNAGAVTEE